jgi:hypothetical protein
LISFNQIRLPHRFSILNLWQFAILAIVLSCLAQSPSPTPTPPAQEVPVIDGGVGPCSVEFTVTDANAKPQYAATVKVRIAYGFAGVKKLNLEAGTNVNGKVKFKGLPAKVHNPPLEFNAVKDDLTGMATYNPAAECEAKHDLTLEKPKAASSN